MNPESNMNPESTMNPENALNLENTMLAKQIKDSTISSLSDVTQALKDSAQHLKESASYVNDDDYVASTLLTIGAEREEVHNHLSELIRDCDGQPATESSFMCKLRMIWTAMRAALNSGNPTVLLIEAEKAEAALLEQFRNVLSEAANVPLTVRLNEFYEILKSGSDRIVSLRNKYECAINS